MTKATRDAVTREIFEVNEQIRLQSFELVGPMAFPPDLTMRQLHVLVAASREEGVTVHELANAQPDRPTRDRRTQARADCRGPTSPACPDMQSRPE